MDAPTARPEGVDALAPEWSAEDKAWLKTQPTEFQRVAAQHGKIVFQLVMCGGQTSYALGILNKFAGNAAIKQAMLVLLKLTNQMMKIALEKSGITMQQYTDCKRDVETVGALMNPNRYQEGDSVTSGGIIVKPH